jgi:hypothetical protein
MRYHWQVSLWENGHKSTDYTQHVAAPIFFEDKLDETLDSGEIILENMPIATRDAFPPKTKFRLERYLNADRSDTPRTWDLIVDHDDVEEYVGLPSICCHRVHLIEASAVAQGMHVDNIALTYELNDVTLNYKTVISDSKKAAQEPPRAASGLGYTRPTWTYGGAYAPPEGVGMSWYRPTTPEGNDSSTTYYTNSFSYVWSGLDVLNSFNANLNGLVSHHIEFQMPILQCFWNNGGNANLYPLFDCPTRCTVTRTTLNNGNVVSGTAVSVGGKFYSPSGVNNQNERVLYNSGGKAGLRGTWTGSFREESNGNGVVGYQIKVFRESQITNLPAMINTNDTSHSSRTVSFDTTPLTDQDFNNLISYRYSINLTIEPYESGAAVLQYTARTITTEHYFWDGWPLFGSWVTDFNIEYTDYVTANASDYLASVSFLCRNMLEDASPNPFLMKGVKYSCFDLFRKAMLTCDTRIFDNAVIGLDERYNSIFNDIGIQYPIIVASESDGNNSSWLQRVKETTMYESVFEGKNLWEVFIQIGYYLHAIPYLDFDRDGRDRFVLRFKQLGATVTKEDASTKITVFNSKNLSEYFTQYDAYVTNLFSPQNEIDEWLVCKTSDPSCLISNNTAELHTKYNITELVAFDITYNGQTKSALQFVFEKSVYDTLTAKTNYVPAKWSALYFEMGTSKILGLNYVPPTKNNDGFMALKTIVGRLFSNNVSDIKLKFNDLEFHVRYKTQDSLRITQLRPDLERFMKISEFENYPHHEQFYGQQDKIVDSERFSANLFGRLVRVGNGVYQRQEYAKAGNEKESGDLVEFNGGAYYVTETENEYYPDAIFQKVTYSKNFNQLSNIVTIPSEPRFYEVSERSKIRREVRLLDFIKISTEENAGAPAPLYINKSFWHGYIRDLLFADSGNPQLPNFAYTNFKADEMRWHDGLPNNDTSALFPSSEAEVNSEGAVQPKPNASSRAVIVPVLHFPLRNSIVFEWDMEDNFKAGDCSDITTTGNPNPDADTADEAYNALQSVRYCDIYGRADLFDFKLFYKDDWSDAQAGRLPFAEPSDFRPTAAQSIVLVSDNLSVGLDKDNREALSFNYQLNFLHEPDGDGEDFVTFSNLFGVKNGRLKAALLRNRVSMFDEALRIDTDTTVADDVQYSFAELENSIRIDFAPPVGTDVSEVKSIVFYDTENGNGYAYIAKNVGKLPNEKKLQSWWIYHVFNDSLASNSLFTVNIRARSEMGGSGGVTPFGQIQVADGQEITITAAPDTGSTFRRFLESIEPERWYEHTENPLTIAITKDTTITAVFQGGGVST